MLTRLAARAAAGSDSGSGDEAAPAGPSKPSPFDVEGGSSDEEEPPTPTAPVARAAGVKPLPPPPPPRQLAPKAVEWRGVGAGTVAGTRALFAACCPCLVAADKFEPLQ